MEQTGVASVELPVMVSVVYVQVERGQEWNELAQLQSGHMLTLAWFYMIQAPSTSLIP